MTKEETEYFMNKYKTFIEVWQSSHTKEHVRIRLHNEHGWVNGMEEIAGNDYWKTEWLSMSAVNGYAWRLRQKGVRLKHLPLTDAPSNKKTFKVDYDELKGFAESCDIS